MSSDSGYVFPPGAARHYGYVPHEYVAIIFISLFGISTIVHVGQVIYYRMWWLLFTACLCGAGELVGWSGRLWSSLTPDQALTNPYMMQITTTIIAPTPLIAVNFILLTWIITRLGPCYARLTPSRYSLIFTSCDIFALVVQGAGGGIASGAHTVSGTQLGSNIMLGGIIFQFVAIIAYAALASDFFWHYSKDRPVHADVTRDRGCFELKMKTMVGALAFSTLVLFIRSIYRIIELAGGWHGRIIQTEVYFNVLDGGMVVLAIVVINLAHPGWLLGPQHTQAYLHNFEKTPGSARSSTGSLVKPTFLV
ncbi:RTA1-like protein [Roridomyces roridus]|uniref:RTA1-like protein n=1 Tax=Roridomyces roridus TaxID=1738132 RepID=A0AAD7FSZ6_9AGAR|nr:RTA1-like protein [Roridomyces roridus]